jgi:Cupin-like domain
MESSESTMCKVDQSHIETKKWTMPRWTVEDIVSLCCGSNIQMTVNVTPDGHGDVIRTVSVREEDTDIESRSEQVFLLPEERIMGFKEFVTAMRQQVSPNNNNTEVDEIGLPILKATYSTDSPGILKIDAINDCKNLVYYYSLQNDCLRTEFPELLDHLQPITHDFISWAEEAFGTQGPDAMNLWIGNQQATSSLHKDYYENLFYVASGEKVFTLYPPSDAAILPTLTVPSLRFHQTSTACNSRYNATDCISHGNDHTAESNSWMCYLDQESTIEISTPWIYLPSSNFKYQKYLHPLTVHLHAGEVLYLPAMWFHEVSQTTETVAINWWFDMQYQSPLYCYFQLLEGCHLHTIQCDQESDSTKS